VLRDKNHSSPESSNTITVCHGDLLRNTPLLRNGEMNVSNRRAFKALVLYAHVEDGELACRALCDAEEDLMLISHLFRGRFVNGDVVIADTAATNGFLPACKEFEKYVTANYKRG
jgi:hypothetical protein